MTHSCSICSSQKLRYLFSKPSKDNTNYDIFQCKNCKIVQVVPLPSQEILDRYYSNEYFTSRTDRGYENYYSQETRNEIFRVWNLNLNDLGVDFIDLNKLNPRSLDVGCAAGYFVDYMKSMGWRSMGIEIAPDPIKFAREKLHLDIVEGNFLEWDKSAEEKFNLITLWASIEHMREPIPVLKKMHSHLTDDGMLILSTCRWGFLAKFLKQKWRFLNVPEHLFYFGLKELIQIMEGLGYIYQSSITYGSGMTMKKNPSWGFLLFKKIFDWSVKLTNQGDMMAIRFKKGSFNH